MQPAQGLVTTALHVHLTIICMQVVACRNAQPAHTQSRPIMPPLVFSAGNTVRSASMQPTASSALEGPCYWMVPVCSTAHHLISLPLLLWMVWSHHIVTAARRPVAPATAHHNINALPAPMDIIYWLLMVWVDVYSSAPTATTTPALIGVSRVDKDAWFAHQYPIVPYVLG